MIIYTDTVKTWATRPPRTTRTPSATVLAQTSLAMHLQFNANLPPSPMFRSYGFIRTAVADGAPITVNGPWLAASGLSELTVELFTDNGASAALVNEFDTTGAHVGEKEAIAAAVAKLPSLGLDAAELIMKMTTDPASASRPQRLDVANDALVDEPFDGLFR
ncbi:hypothetical protein [Mycolicibacterium brumae]|uniref:hypothetical protein n=1 Tax=Mycolicibacterium brumae TaxID=85968 RepID=UPI000FE21942|nr:hypothetical protein [Mycolicibacterium brumae]MCV7194029.1 hypothetical protein [Mycolicibacterium brumae]UWW09702.1 hypothetical protein L2Z93_002813 [Mycolicibacterium brumae]